MKLSSTAFVSLLLMSAFAIRAQEASGRQTNASEQELVALSTQWMEALERKDQAALERFLAEDFYISAPGELNKVRRSEWLKNALEMDWRNLRYHNFKVDLYGDTAVVASLLDFKVTTKSGIPISTNTQVTDIWVKRDGQWQVAARHLGAYSIGGHFRLAAGFVAGLTFCLLVWLLQRLRRRLAAKRRPAAT